MAWGNKSVKTKIVLYLVITLSAVLAFQLNDAENKASQRFEMTAEFMQDRIDTLYYQLQSIQYGMSHLSTENSIYDSGLTTSVISDGTCHISKHDSESQMYDFETNFLVVSNASGCDTSTELHHKIRDTIKISPMMTFLAGRMKDVISLYFISLDKFIITSPKYNALVVKPDEFDSVLFKRPYMVKPLLLGVNNLGNRIFISGPYKDLSINGEVITFSIAIYIEDAFYGMLNMDILWKEFIRSVPSEIAVTSSVNAPTGNFIDHRHLLFDGEPIGLSLSFSRHWADQWRYLFKYNLTDLMMYFGFIFISFGIIHLRNVKHESKKLALQSKLDPLTGLLNRRGFMQAIEELGKYKFYSFMIMDLDDFKNVNDTYGHATGDDVLTSFSNVVREQIRDKDIFTRLGGEEFGLLIGYNNEDKERNIFQRICTNIALLPHYADEHEFHVTISGGAITTDSYESIKDIKSVMAQADSLLYEAKNAGKNQILYAVYNALDE